MQDGPDLVEKSRGDKTAIELFIAGILAGGLRRGLDDGKSKPN